MTWYDDSILLLNEAKEQLNDLKSIEFEAVRNEDLLNKAKPKIKNFLENCRSPLDYIVNDAVNTFKLKGKSKRIYFPITYNNKYFESTIFYSFEDIKNTLPELYSFFEKYQCFYGNDQSTGYLSHLVNNNKHQELSTQENSLVHHVESMKIGGNFFSNCTFANCDIPVQIGDAKYDFIDNVPVDTKHVSRRTIIFKELDLDVIPLLENILKAVSNIVDDASLILGRYD